MAVEYILGTLLLIISILLGLRQLTAPWRRKVKQTKLWLDRFMRDWSGEEEEDGRDAVPGVMERLNKLDGELSNNGGSSLKDKVEASQKTLDELTEKVDGIDEKLETILKKVSNKTPSPLI